MEMYYLYSIKTGELRIREGETDGCWFYYKDDKGEHRITFTGNCEVGAVNSHGFRGHANCLIFLKERNDKLAISTLLENQRLVVEDARKQLENLEKRIPYLEEMLEQA